MNQFTKQVKIASLELKDAKEREKLYNYLKKLEYAERACVYAASDMEPSKEVNRLQDLTEEEKKEALKICAAIEKLWNQIHKLKY